MNEDNQAVLSVNNTVPAEYVNLNSFRETPQQRWAEIFTDQGEVKLKQLLELLNHPELVVKVEFSAPGTKLPILTFEDDMNDTTHGLEEERCSAIYNINKILRNE